MIAVARSGGESYAIADGQIVCPRHGARFKALIPVTLVWLFAEGIMAYAMSARGSLEVSECKVFAASSKPFCSGSCSRACG
jgi:hypothetical protein